MFRNAALLAILVSSSASAATADSRYQSIVIDDPDTTSVEGPCRITESGGELADYFHADCGPFGDYRLAIVGGDVREYLEVTHRNGTPSLLNIPGAVGGAFSYLPASVVEWRGEVRNGRFQPYALIVRVQAIGVDEDGEYRNRQVLAVSKISPAGSCFVQGVTVTRAGNANLEARRIADTVVRNATCPVE